MARDPRETWAKLQQTLASAQQQGRKGLGGNPRGFFGGAAGLLLLGGGALIINNALFNGMPYCLLVAANSAIPVRACYLPKHPY